MNNLKKSSGLSLFLLGGVVLAGCQSPIQPLGKMNASFGNSVRQNMAVQIVDPEASKGITEARRRRERGQRDQDLRCWKLGNRC
jgi:hypothetical protein